MKACLYFYFLTTLTAQILIFSPTAHAQTRIEEVGVGIGTDTETACYQALLMAQARAHQRSEKYITSVTSSHESISANDQKQNIFQQKTSVMESNIKSTHVKARTLSLTEDGLIKCDSMFEFIIDNTPIANHIKKSMQRESERITVDLTREAISKQINLNTKKFIDLSQHARTIAQSTRSTRAETACRNDDISACDYALNIILTKEIKGIIQGQLGIDQTNIDAAIHRQLGTMRFSRIDEETQKMIWIGSYSADVQINDPFETQNRLLLDQLRKMENESLYSLRPLEEFDSD